MWGIRTLLNPYEKAYNSTREAIHTLGSSGVGRGTPHRSHHLDDHQHGDESPNSRLETRDAPQDSGRHTKPSLRRRGAIEYRNAIMQKCRREMEGVFCTSAFLHFCIP